MKSKGYTLIELAIVFTIGGVMIASTGSMMLVYMTQAKVSETTMKLERANIALRQYVLNNGKYPCPTSRLLDVTDPNYGYEASADCTGTLSGVVDTPGNGASVRIGSLPTRTLGLPDDDMLDGWQNRFVYAVTQPLANVDTFVQDKGAIYIKDRNDHNIQYPLGSAHYAVISLGADGAGAYTVHGQQFKTCPTGTVQTENCNDDAYFRSVMKTSTNTANAFDDMITYGSQFEAPRKLANIPKDAIAPFDSTTLPTPDSCPPGWVRDSRLDGNVIIGAGRYSENISDTDTDAEPDPNLFRRGWNFNTVYQVGQTFGAPKISMKLENMPPHTHKYRLYSATPTEYTGNGSAGWAPYPHETGAEPPQPNISAGLGRPHENRQPWLALVYCRKQ